MDESFDWFQPNDLPLFFAALRQIKEPAVLVGGQSLIFWVKYYSIDIPQTEYPDLTQDADILGTKDDAKLVADFLNGTLDIPEPDDHTPNTAIVTYKTQDGRKLLVDFMGALTGLDFNEIKETAVVFEHEEYGTINILHPRLVLISRINNLKIHPRKRNGNGISQCRLSVDVYEHFITEFALGIPTNKRDDYLIKSINALANIAMSDAGVFVFKKYGIDLFKAAPTAMVSEPQFHARNLPKLLEWIDNKRK